MKTRNFVAIGLVLALSLFVLPGSTQASDPVSESSEYANASWSTDDGCVYTYVDIQASEYTFHQPPGPPQQTAWVWVYFNQYDCNGGTVFGVSGSAPLTAGEFEMLALKSATLSKAVPGYDWVSGQDVTVSVDLTWTADGEIQRYLSNSHSISPGSKYHSRYRTSYRSASASGTVSLEGINYAVGPSTWGSFYSYDWGSAVGGR